MRCATQVFGLALGLQSALLIGCAESGGRCAVAGVVTYAGKPLENGYLVFRPLDLGQTAGAKIERGRYQVPTKEGLLPGKYHVEIKAMRLTGQKYTDSDTGKQAQAREQFLPAKYNSQTELSVQVSLEGENKFDFELQE